MSEIPIEVRGHVDQRAVDQLRTCASPDVAIRGALCADAHVGYSQPIGGAVAYPDHVSVSGVGYDIGCGNKAVATSLQYGDVRGQIPQLMDEIFRRVDFGVGRKNQDKIEHPVIDRILRESPDRAVRALHQKAAAQLGTVGSGNHYVDLFRDRKTDRIWIGVHFGSRGFGHAIASGYMARAAGLQFDERVTEGEMDSPPILLDVRGALGETYLQAMALAGDYAYAGRDVVCDKVLGILGAQAIDEVHNHHNDAWRERVDGTDAWVVRKGCTPAFDGQRGFVGATMGEANLCTALAHVTTRPRPARRLRCLPWMSPPAARSNAFCCTSLTRAIARGRRASASRRKARSVTSSRRSSAPRTSSSDSTESCARARTTPGPASPAWCRTRPRCSESHDGGRLRRGGRRPAPGARRPLGRLPRLRARRGADLPQRAVPLLWYRSASRWPGRTCTIRGRTDGSRSSRRTPCSGSDNHRKATATAPRCARKQTSRLGLDARSPSAKECDSRCNTHPMPTTNRRIGLVVDETVDGALAALRAERRDLPDAALARTAVLESAVFSALVREARSTDRVRREESQRILALVRGLLPSLGLPDRVAAEVRRSLETTEAAEALDRRRAKQRALLAAPDRFGAAILEETERFDALEAGADG